MRISEKIRVKPNFHSHADFRFAVHLLRTSLQFRLRELNQRPDYEVYSSITDAEVKDEVLSVQIAAQ